MDADAASAGPGSTDTGTAAGKARDGRQDYSGTPLPRKLGIGEDDELAVIGAPDGFTDTLRALLAADLPEVADGMHTDLSDDARYDVILTFVTERTELGAELPRLRARMAPACGLWVAWPKRSSGLPTDMSDDVVREIALPTGLVDNKVCAISPAWTGLRLVIRRDLR